MSLVNDFPVKGEHDDHAGTMDPNLFALPKHLLHHLADLTSQPGRLAIAVGNKICQFAMCALVAWHRPVLGDRIMNI